jgi:predicted RNA-binding Zn-ribbon protein involved in translation (DUF1610 family)
MTTLFRKNIILCETMDSFICPKCGKTTMVKQEIQHGKYQLVCERCGFQSPLQIDNEKNKSIV